MEFDEIVVKESPGLCRCCLSEGCYKDLGTEYTWMDETEVYADILLECFDISISQHMEGPNGPNRLICEVCITRLRDACNFKKQVLDSEKKFVDMVGRGEFKSKVIVYQEQMKSEMIVEPQPAHDADVEYLDEEIDYDDGNKDDSNEPTVSEDITVDALPIKGKRGRPKKSTVKPEKKKSKLEEKTKPKIVKDRIEKDENQKSIPSKKKTRMQRNDESDKQDSTLDFMRKNTIQVLEKSTIIPFRWLRTCFRCFYCYEMFEKTETLKSHQETHTVKDIRDTMENFCENLVVVDISDISCKICFAKLDDVFQLLDHLVTCHEMEFNEDVGINMAPIKLDDGAKCVFCSMVFKTFNHLIVHMDRYHKGCFKSVCTSCRKHFKSTRDFCGHVQKQFLEDNLKCSQCDLFLNYGVLRSHMREVHGMKYKCLSCYEFFPSHYKRSNHMADIHNRRKKIKCSFCSRSFIFRSILMRHVRENHLKEKNVVCEICGWRTYGKHELANHMARHDNVKRVRCPSCDKAFKTNKYMKKHYIKTHE
ncbi:zinc finger protein Xfin-like isoform X12 [Vanessa tameamea]|uniref:Zinc finger protein Xfin-like isoform X12 n=1 Tax=Vanessa tameamea TaxID=334116 RepID=A0ABM4AXE2_VANTA